VKSEKGAVLALVVLLALFLFGAAAIAADAGLLYYEKRTLQSAADLAVLAGAQELPKRPKQAREVALAVLAANGINSGEIDSVRVERLDTELVVRLKRSVGLFFARVLGWHSSLVPVQARARVEAVSTSAAVVPWGIESDTEEYVHGEEYVLKWNAGNHDAPLAGNYHILNYTGKMTPNDYSDWVAYNYPGTVSVGDVVETKTGNLGIHTRNGLQRRALNAESYNCSLPDPEPACPMVVIVPIVRTFVDMNGHGHVVVEGFGRFLITRWEEDGNTPNITVYGAFLERMEDKAVSPDARNVGMKRIVLVE
jgi:hypothetical protein